MRSLEERRKDNKEIAVGFFVAGVIIAGISVVCNITQYNAFKDEYEQEEPIEEVVEGYYMIDYDGNILSKCKDDEKTDDSEDASEEESDDMRYKRRMQYRREHAGEIDFKLPYKHYNLQSATDGVLTEAIFYFSDNKLKEEAFYPFYEKMGDDRICLYDGFKRKYGVTDGEGHWIIEPEYDYMRTDFYDEYGLLWVGKNDGGSIYYSSTLMDIDGNELLEYKKYSSIDISNNMMITYRYESDYGNVCEVYDIGGNLVYQSVGDELDIKVNKDNPSMYIVDPDGNGSLLDLEGHELIKGGCSYLKHIHSDSEDHEDFFVVKDNDGKYYTCDEMGKEYTPHEYDSLAGIYDDILIAEKDGKKGIIDSKGNVKLEVCYKDIVRFWDESGKKTAFVVTTMDDEVGVYAVESGFITEPQRNKSLGEYHYSYENNMVYFFSEEGRYEIHRQGKAPVLIDQGQITFNKVGLFIVTDNSTGRKYAIDLDGKLLFEEGGGDILCGKRDGKFFFFVTDHTGGNMTRKLVYDGEVKFECDYYDIELDDFRNIEKRMEVQDHYVVKGENGLYGLVNYKGELVVDHEYSNIEVDCFNASSDEHSERIILRTTDGKEGVMVEKLEWIYKPQFSTVEDVAGDYMKVKLEDGQVIVR